MDQDRESCRLSLPTKLRISRRELLSRLVALPAALESVTLIASESTEARKKRRKHSRKRRGRNRGGGGNGGDNGGGSDSPDAEERAFLALINDHRRANNRSELRLHNQLGVAAERHSQDQAANGFSGHTGSDGSTPDQRITDAGYDRRSWGENAYWHSNDGSANAAFTW